MHQHCSAALFRSLLLFICPFFAVSCTSFAQSVEAGARVPEVGLYLGEAVANTQLPAYADNAIGFDAAMYLQSASILGLEVRASTYPVSAHFAQSPMTAGLRAAFTDHEWNPYIYLGGGLSYGTDSGTSWRQALPSQFYPAWQGSLGVDYRYGKLSFRLGEISLTNAYTPQHTLRTAAVSAGIVMHFKP
jgi:hypothetical protein